MTRALVGFVSEDKIGFMGGINFYGYVENRPVLLTDPLGLAPQCPPVPNDPCHTYDKCGRNDLGAICRGLEMADRMTACEDVCKKVSTVVRRATTILSGGDTGRLCTCAVSRSAVSPFPVTENRLTQAIVPNVGPQPSATILSADAFTNNHRVSRATSSTTAQNLIQTMNSSGVEVASYTQGVYIDEPLAEFRSGGSSYYQTDALGSITSIGGSSGTPANTYSYDSFGNVTASSGTLPNYFEYTGRDFDPETSLYYYRARYYDPTVGRFLSEDPWNQGPNLYVYVQNDPTNLIDPLGLYSIAPPRPGHPPTPPPSPALDSLLHCIENRLHISLTVTSTTEGSHQDPGHAAGTSVDIRPPSSVSADALFCAAGQCGAQWGINEGQSAALPTNHWFQLSHSASPTKQSTPQKQRRDTAGPARQVAVPVPSEGNLHATQSDRARSSVVLASFYSGLLRKQLPHCSLPQALQREVADKYPGARIVTLKDLAEDDKTLFQKDHGNDCPGLVNLNFYGDGKPTIALVLIVNTGTTVSAELVVAHELAQKWATVLIEKAESSIPVVWSQGPGEYKDVYGEKEIRATGPVIVFL